MRKSKRFVVIDAYALIHRAYHALPALHTQQGEQTNAVFGFSSILLRVLKEFNPTYIAAAFDLEDETFRKKEFQQYKAQRKKAPDELYAQIPRVREVLGAFHIPILSHPGYEGDDIIGTLVCFVENNHPDVENIIVSGDLDTLQLISGRTKVYTLRRGVSDTILYDNDAVVARYGFDADYIAEYKGLRGDASDNIPGVQGVGEKTASRLIAEHKTLETIFRKLKEGQDIGVSKRIEEQLLSSEEDALFSRMLATIKQDVPLQFALRDATWGLFDPNEVRALFQDLHFYSLVERLRGIRGFEEGSLFAKQMSRKQEMQLQLDDAWRSTLLSQELYDVEKALIPIVEKMEKKGIMLHERVLQDVQKKIEKKLRAIEAKIYEHAGQAFNVNSPRQISEVLFDVLKIPSKGVRKTSTKAYSTSADQLEKIQDKHPIVPLILQQRELQKLVSTYLTPLPKYKQQDNRIHSQFIPLGTTTGRMSSNHPNLQNIPIRGEWASMLRKAFVAEKGNLFLACDYSQMELRVVAHMANDQNMRESFLRGEDIHQRTASLVFGVDIDKVDSDMRYRAKALNFGIIYGIGARSFARSAGISPDEAREFMDTYLAVFRGIAQYMEDAKEMARQHGYAITMYGRKRFLPDIHSSNPLLRSIAERVAINMPIQGTAADIVKMAMVRTDKEFPDIDLVLQVHDELLWEGKKDVIISLQDRVAETLETVVSLSAPLKVVSHSGASWDVLKS